MGGAQSNTARILEESYSNIVQKNTNTFNTNCSNNFDGNTVVIDGGEGNFEISNTCTIDNVSGFLSNSVEGEIKTILESMSKQDASASGFSFNFNTMSNDVRMEQLIENNITQIQENSCNFQASNSIDNNYIYIKNQKGDVKLFNESTISGSTCNLSNIAKATTYQEATSSNDQKTSITGFNFMILMVIVIIIILCVIIYYWRKFTGGSKQVDQEQAQQNGFEMTNRNQTSGENFVGPVYLYPPGPGYSQYQDYLQQIKNPQGVPYTQKPIVANKGNLSNGIPI